MIWGVYYNTVTHRLVRQQMTSIRYPKVLFVVRGTQADVIREMKAVEEVMTREELEAL